MPSVPSWDLSKAAVRCLSASTPVTAGSSITVEAIIASLDGSTVLRDTIQGEAADAARLGQKLGNKMLDQGGRAILAEIM